MTKFVMWFAGVCLLAGPTAALAQQQYVGRFDLYNGFVWFDSPSAKLQQRGYHLQAGVNLRRWLALGFDYSVAQGNLVLRTDLLKPALAQQINGQIAALEGAGQLPSGYGLAVNTDTLTQTFAAGPQLEYRHWERVTLFIRPSIGAIRETATPRPGDPFATAVVTELAPSGKKTDWQAFYGLGGGVDLNFLRWASIRLQADFVHNDLFTDILKDSRNTVRLSVGPAFHFGRNIAQ